MLMFNGASMFETSVPMSVFGMNPAGAPAFTVLPVAGETGRMRTSDGVGFDPPHGLEALDRAGIVVLPGWRSPHDAPPPGSLEAVRTAHADGALIVSLCMGAFVLAATGLLDGRRAAAHWFHAPTLAARYPSVRVDPSVLFIDDGDIVTSAGTAAGLDACLHVVRRHWGAAAATAIARHLVLSPARCGSQAQFVDRPVPLRSEDVELGRVMEYAIAHLQHVDIDALAARAGLSRRTFDRRFRVQTGVSPLQWLLHQRILRAQNLLERTELTVDAIARQVGLATAVSLRPAFRRIVGVSPQAYRQAFRTVDTHAGTDRQCGLTN
ncbi:MULTISPECIES: GlxA family transcriptional regulator [unclassified Mycobacterium]|uniref:GlxA family transcriptional regulator n=1 Tax=unclassified Mycobacterium TaxID=2642494 RepID=UPI0018D2F6B5|nr:MULTISPECIES: helix-turn-helix domain-containing protein [unclassified Mycobacterium]